MSRKPDVWMPFFIGDYLADTAHLTTVQHGAYLLLLIAAWKRRGTLPDDDTQLAAITRLTPAVWRNHRSVLVGFFDALDGHLVQKRLMAEYENAVRANDAQRDNGKKGGRPKRNETHGKPTGFGWVNPNESPSPSPSEEASKYEISGHTPPAAAGSGDRIGTFEGHYDPVTTPNPVAAYAIALTRLGFRCTSLNPDLVAYQQAGGTVDHLTQCAALPDCQGKPATYAIRVARRELAEPAKTITPGARAGPGRALSKTAEAFLTLEGMKSENRLDARRGFEGAAKAAFLVAGPDPSE